MAYDYDERNGQDVVEYDGFSICRDPSASRVLCTHQGIEGIRRPQGFVPADWTLAQVLTRWPKAGKWYFTPVNADDKATGGEIVKLEIDNDHDALRKVAATTTTAPSSGGTDANLALLMAQLDAMRNDIAAQRAALAAEHAALSSERRELVEKQAALAVNAANAQSGLYTHVLETGREQAAALSVAGERSMAQVLAMMQLQIQQAEAAAARRATEAEEARRRDLAEQDARRAREQLAFEAALERERERRRVEREEERDAHERRMAEEADRAARREREDKAWYEARMKEREIEANNRTNPLAGLITLATSLGFKATDLKDLAGKALGLGGGDEGGGTGGVLASIAGTVIKEIGETSRAAMELRREELRLSAGEVDLDDDEDEDEEVEHAPAPLALRPPAQAPPAAPAEDEGLPPAVAKAGRAMARRIADGVKATPQEQWTGLVLQELHTGGDAVVAYLRVVPARRALIEAGLDMGKTDQVIAGIRAFQHQNNLQLPQGVRLE